MCSSEVHQEGKIGMRNGNPGPDDDRNQSLLVTMSRACKLLSIGRTTLYGLIKDNTIPQVHVGRCARISMKEIDAYVSNLRVEPRSEKVKRDVTPAARKAPNQTSVGPSADLQNPAPEGGDRDDKKKIRGEKRGRSGGKSRPRDLFSRSQESE